MTRQARFRRPTSSPPLSVIATAVVVNSLGWPGTAISPAEIAVVNPEVPGEIAAGQSGISSVQVGAPIEMAQTDVQDLQLLLRSRRRSGEMRRRSLVVW